MTAHTPQPPKDPEIEAMADVFIEQYRLIGPSYVVDRSIGVYFSKLMRTALDDVRARQPKPIGRREIGYHWANEAEEPTAADDAEHFYGRNPAASPEENL